MRCPSADCTGTMSFVIFSDPGKGSGTMSFVIFSDPGRGSGTMCQLHNNTNDRQTNDIFQVHMTVNALYVDRLWCVKQQSFSECFKSLQQPRSVQIKFLPHNVANRLQSKKVGKSSALHNSERVEN